MKEVPKLNEIAMKQTQRQNETENEKLAMKEWKKIWFVIAGKDETKNEEKSEWGKKIFIHSR